MNNQNSIFGREYAEYYNLLYNEKNYFDEYKYIREILKQNGTTKKEILDIGCGTGNYLNFFKRDGFSIFGVDISENMINEAKKNLNQANNLICAKASEFNLDKKFEIIISLFHVMSYQTENCELEKVFLNISEHLVEGGLFIFDFWYGPAVISDPPVVRIKRLENNEIKITRIAKPVMHYNNNIAEIHFEIIVEDQNTHICKRIHEVHEMRYLFLPEIKKFAEKAEFSFINSYKWMSFSSLSEKTWYGLVILKKK